MLRITRFALNNKKSKKENNCEIRVTENVLEKIALRIGKLFKEQGFCANGHIVSNDRECARVEIKGWVEE